MAQSFKGTTDASFQLQASVTKTATFASTEIDLGATNGVIPHIVALVELLVTAITITGVENETYIFGLEVDTATGFTTAVRETCAIRLGDKDATPHTADSETGRYYMLFDNEYNGVTHRFVRLNCTIAGTTPSITYEANIVPLVI